VESFVVRASTKGAAYKRGQLETALQQVTDGITLCRQFAYLAAGRRTGHSGAVPQADGDTADALDDIAEAERVTPRPDQEQARHKSVPLGAAVRTNI
jgi:hypothetical protein